MDEISPSQRLQLDVLEEEYRRKHGVAIELIKAAVGEGDSFENDVARVVLSDNGGWCELLDLPMEFTGSAGGPVEHRFISDHDLTALTDSLACAGVELNSTNARVFGLLLLYKRSGVVNALAAYGLQLRLSSVEASRPPIIVGEYRPGTLPRLIKARIDADAAPAGVPFKRGVIIGLAGVGESNLLVLISHEGDDVRDLGAAPVSLLPN